MCTVLDSYIIVVKLCLSSVGFLCRQTEGDLQMMQNKTKTLEGRYVLLSEEQRHANR